MTEPNPETITPTLLQRLQVRDNLAWQKLYDLFRPLVREWARRGGVPDADQDDVVQETFAKLNKALDGFRRDRPGDTFGGWLRIMTRHRIADYHARRREPAAGGTAALQILEQIPENGEPATLDPSDNAAIQQRALESLSAEFEPRTWQAFQMLTVDGYRADVVAEKLGMNVGAVYVAKSRVLKRLKEEFRDLI
jgi:RNA polymerase sigma-70 factor (ECF subfamily)